MSTSSEKPRSYVDARPPDVCCCRIGVRSPPGPLLTHCHPPTHLPTPLPTSHQPGLQDATEVKVITDGSSHVNIKPRPQNAILAGTGHGLTVDAVNVHLLALPFPVEYTVSDTPDLHPQVALKALFGEAVSTIMSVRADDCPSEYQTGDHGTYFSFTSHLILTFFSLRSD